MEENSKKLNQQTLLKMAKDACALRLPLEDFDQNGEYSYLSLEEVGGEEIWVEIKLVAKKNFNADDSIEEWEIEKELKEKREKEKEKKKKI